MVLLAAEDLGCPVEATDTDDELWLWVKTLREELGSRAGDLEEACELVACLYEYKVPALPFAFGKFWPLYIAGAVIRELTGEIPSGIPLRMEHFLPDNPLMLAPDGRTVQNMDQATPRHALEMISYFASLRPARPRGRPRKPPVPQPSLPPRADDELARRAYALKQARQSPTQIARALLPSLPGYDLEPGKSRERTRKKVDRLIYRGSMLPPA
ncbi:MAG: hypothetical protein HYZ81_00545 [Nitrospinae bacterium]|nr:hypothetical protein [Nitrospinota bacterium]